MRMKTTGLAGVVSLCLAACTAAAPATAQTAPQQHDPVTLTLNCLADRSQAEQVHARWGQVVFQRGLVSTNGEPLLMEFWLNPTNQRWAVTLADATGTTCLVTRGTNFTLAELPDAVPEGELM
ncbi:MAG: hypothetical protein AAF808_03240 [Cyanobacteria bacterium P01_D01_bin.2]